MGKTSFIDLIKRDLNSDEFIHVDFNPWASQSANLIINDFFEAVQENLPSQSMSLNRLLSRYAQKIGSNHSIKFLHVSQILTVLWDNPSTEQLFKKINAALQKAGKKLVVYIDDVDRLDKSEILEVVKLIRNTANFYNTFFIVAYDREYLINALKSHNSHNQKSFLEKIFQLEINLPSINKEILRKQLAEKLMTKLPKEIHKAIEDDIIGKPWSDPAYLNEWLNNMRDVTRLANSIIINSKNLIGEMVFNDLLRLELLRLKYPSIYELLSRKPEDFLEPKNISGNKYSTLVLKLVPDDSSEKHTSSSKNKTIFEKFLLENPWAVDINELEAEKIISLCESLFYKEGPLMFYERDPLSVAFPSRFNIYFAYDLTEGRLSNVEFSHARSEKSEVFNEKINIWVNLNLESELRSKFEMIKHYDNREDFEKIIKGIFFLANLPSKKERSDSFYNIVDYTNHDLADKLSNFRGEIVSKYYSNDSETFRSFVLNVFQNAQSPFLYEANFLSYLNNGFRPSEIYYLTEPQRKNICLKYLKNYCLEVENLNEIVWFLYNSCRLTEWVEVDKNRLSGEKNMPQEAIAIFKELILTKGFNQFLHDIVDKTHREKEIYAVNERVLEIFESWANFEEILESKSEDDHPYLNEYKQFYIKFAETNHKNYVPFSFKIIPV